MTPIHLIVSLILSFVALEVGCFGKSNDFQLAPLFKSPHYFGDGNRYIVVLKPSVGRYGMQRAIRMLLMRRDGITRIHHEYTTINGFSVTISNESLDILRHSSDVRYIEQDSIMKAYHHIYDGNCLVQQNSGWCLGRVDNVKGSSKYQYGNNIGKGVTVYVIDTGTNAKHSDFNGRATQCASYVPGESGDDLNGHGTGVASLSAGEKAGAAKYASICAIKVLNRRGYGSTSNIIAGIDWASRQSKKGIINLSLGGGYSRASNDAVDRAHNNGHFVVVAAGNEAQDACNVSPASAKHAFTIAASDENNNLARFSNFGSCVNLIAPGVSCLQASLGGGFKYASGTSFASPLVAGVAAAIKSRNSQMTPNELKNRLIASAVKNEIKNVKGTVNLFLHARCV